MPVGESATKFRDMGKITAIVAAGNAYSNHVYSLIGDEMVIESASAESGRRKYVRVDDLP